MSHGRCAGPARGAEGRVGLRPPAPGSWESVRFREGRKRAGPWWSDHPRLTRLHTHVHIPPPSISVPPDKLNRVSPYCARFLATSSTCFGLATSMCPLTPDDPSATLLIRV